MPKRKTSRNTQGSGSIRQRPDGRWEGRYTVGVNPATGKQNQRSVYGVSEAEVAKKLRKIVQEIDEGTFYTPSKITVKQWFDTWLSEFIGDVKNGTAVNYRQHVNNHIVPSLGYIKLKALRCEHIQKLYNECHREGLNAKTIKNLHGVIHRALDSAVRNGYIPSNPSNACTLPRIIKKEILPFDSNDIRRFMEALKGHAHEILFKVDLFTGLRSGEILGLTWDCIDFDKGTIYVYRQITPPREAGATYKFAPLKNDKTRTIAPAPQVMALLRTQKKKQAEQRIAVGDKWNAGEFPNLVFTDEFGKHLTQSGLWRNLQTVLKHAGIEQHRFHDLRHSYAVLSIRAGDDITTLQANLGHHAAAFTLDQYSHFTEQMRKESSERIKKLVEREFAGL